MYVIAEMDEASDVAKCMEVLIKVGFRRLFVFEDLFVAASTLHKGKRNTDIEPQSVSLGNGDVNLQSTSQNFFPSECYQFTNGQKSCNTNDIDVKIEDESDSIRSDFSSSSVQELDHDQSGNGKKNGGDCEDVIPFSNPLHSILSACTSASVKNSNSETLNSESPPPELSGTSDINFVPTIIQTLRFPRFSQCSTSRSTAGFEAPIYSRSTGLIDLCRKRSTVKTEEGISSITSYSTPKKIADDERLQMTMDNTNGNDDLSVIFDAEGGSGLGVSDIGLITNQRVDTQDEIRKHILMCGADVSKFMTEDGKVICQVCGSYVEPNHPGNVSRHAQRHAARNRFRCLFCTYEGNRKNRLKEHMVKRHESDADPIDMLDSSLREEWNQWMKQCFPYHGTVNFH